MYTTYYDPEREARDKLIYHKELKKQWDGIRKTEQRLFIAVLKAWRKNKSDGRWNQPDELPEWVTREQIARELDTPNSRLIPYNIKLLNHLCDGKARYNHDALHWILKAKRTRWRDTYEGIKRPAGYEWVYLPREDVIEGLKAMNPNNPKREAARPTRPALPPAPKYQVSWWERAIDSILDRL